MTSQFSALTDRGRRRSKENRKKRLGSRGLGIVGRMDGTMIVATFAMIACAGAISEPLSLQDWDASVVAHDEGESLELHHQRGGVDAAARRCLTTQVNGIFLVSWCCCRL